MPTITVDKQDLFELVGESFSDARLKQLIDLLKPEIKEITEDEITYELSADRPDLFSVEGLARELKGFTGLAAGLPRYASEESGLVVEAEEVEARPYIACAVISDIRLSDKTVKSLMDIQEVLTDTLGRNRKKVAIGIHDLEAIRPPIRYMAAHTKTKIIPLDLPEPMSMKEVLEKHPKGRRYRWILEEAKEYPAFVDEAGVFSFPPIINSERTRVTEKTRDLFIDMTGLDEITIMNVMNILVTNLADRGGKIKEVQIRYPDRKTTTPKLEYKEMRIDIDFVNRIIGLNLSMVDLKGILERMRFGGEAKGNTIDVTIPPHRIDILHQVDIIEDTAIGYGFDKIEPEPPSIKTVGRESELEKYTRKLRDLMIGFNFQEVNNYIMTNKEVLFARMEQPSESVVEVEEPKSILYSVLRNRILPTMLNFLSKNTSAPYPQRIFEAGDVTAIDESQETRTRKTRKLAAIISDYTAGFEEMQGILYALLQNLGIVNFKLRKTVNQSYIEGRVAEVLVDGEATGIMGEIHPKVLVNFRLENPVVAMELNLEKLRTLKASAL